MIVVGMAANRMPFFLSFFFPFYFILFFFLAGNRTA